MPLIIVCGLPSSGKTYRARQLVTYFEQKAKETSANSPRSLRVHHISDHSCHLPRSIYGAGNAKLEKDGRATLYSAVKRVLTNNDIVVLDSGNYIKGWRYQLHCEAKNVGTASCVVHVGVQPEKSKEVNDGRLAQDGEGAVNTDSENAPYDPQVHAELLMRFEEPNPMARWDKPLWAVPWDDPEAPCEQIWQEVIDNIGKDGRRTVVRPNAAAVAPPSSSSTHLYELDRTTQSIISRIQDHQRDHPGETGGDVSIPLERKTLTLELPTTSLSIPQLQRLRRQFTSLHRQQMGSGGTGGIGGAGGGLSQQRVGELFVGFLESQWSS